MYVASVKMVCQPPIKTTTEATHAHKHCGNTGASSQTGGYPELATQSWQPFTHLDLLNASFPGHPHQVDAINGQDVVSDVQQTRLGGRACLAEVSDDRRRNGGTIA